jgi:hypothetical protein
MGESFSDEPLPAQPLQRKLSMSKPTDLDELMRLQEQVNFNKQHNNMFHLRQNAPKLQQISFQTQTCLN